MSHTRHLHRSAEVRAAEASERLRRRLREERPWLKLAYFFPYPLCRPPLGGNRTRLAHGVKSHRRTRARPARAMRRFRGPRQITWRADGSWMARCALAGVGRLHTGIGPAAVGAGVAAAARQSAAESEPRRPIPQRRQQAALEPDRPQSCIPVAELASSAPAAGRCLRLTATC